MIRCFWYDGLGCRWKFSYWVAHGTVGYPLLNGIDYVADMKEESSFVEAAYAVFMNNIEMDGNGNEAGRNVPTRRERQS